MIVPWSENKANRENHGGGERKCVGSVKTSVHMLWSALTDKSVFGNTSTWIKGDKRWGRTVGRIISLLAWPRLTLWRAAR